MSNSNKGSKSDLRVKEVEEGGFQVHQSKKKQTPRSRNNSTGDKKFEKNGVEKKTSTGEKKVSGGEGVKKPRSRNSSANQGGQGYGKAGKGGSKAGVSNRHAKQMARQAKLAKDYEDEEWRTVYIGFVERGTTPQELMLHFKDSGEVERLTLKEGFAFMLFKTEASVTKACALDGLSLNGLNLRVAPRKEKRPEVDGEQLFDINMKKFRMEKHEKIYSDVDDFLETFECVGSFSQDKKSANSIVVPGCPPLLDWGQMEAEEGEITLARQAENAPELHTTASIFKAVEVCSPDLDMAQVNIITNRQCLMKLLAPVDPSIVYTTNKCFRMTARKSPAGPLFLELEKKWHPTMGTSKSFQDAITQPLPEMVKNIAFPGIFYRINQMQLGKLKVLVRTQVHAEDEEPMLEFESESGDTSPEDYEVIEKNGDAGDDFFNIEEKDSSDDLKEEVKEVKEVKLRASASEWVPPVREWNSATDGSQLKWIKNDALFCQPESKYEVKTVDIAGNFWEYNAEKSYYQMLLGGVDYLLLGVLLNNEFVINKEEYDLQEVQAKVLGTKNPTDAAIVLSKMERILNKLVELSSSLKEEERLELVFDGRTEHLTFYKVVNSSSSKEISN